MTRFLKPLAVAALVALGSAAQAGIVIDTFQVSQSVLDSTTNSTGVHSAVSGTTSQILGGEREMFVMKMGDAGTDSGIFPLNSLGLAASGGSMTYFSPQATVYGTAYVRWDGTSPSADASNFLTQINSAAGTGLNGIDLTDGASGFNITVTSADAGFPFSLEIYSDTNNWSRVTLLSSGAANYFIPFSAFVFPSPALQTGSNGAANLQSVTALQAIINTGGAAVAGVALDLTVSSAATVPEPGTLALAGLLLTGLAVARRRHNKA